MRVLVSGSREFNDVDFIERCIENENPTLIIHGNCPSGADNIADKYAKRKGIPCIKMDANWDYYNRAAGPIRNRWMLDFCNPDLVLVFVTKESKGARDMLKAANKKEVMTQIYEV
jgi:hypothetical protein